MQVCGNKLLQADTETGAEERNGTVRRIGIEHPVENGAYQQEAEGVQQTDRGHQDDRGERLQPIRPHIAQQAHQLLQAETPGARSCRECI